MKRCSFNKTGQVSVVTKAGFTVLAYIWLLRADLAQILSFHDEDIAQSLHVLKELVQEGVLEKGKGKTEVNIHNSSLCYVL